MPAASRFAKPEKRAVLRDARSLVLAVAVFSFVPLCFVAMIWLIEWLFQFPIWMALLIQFVIAMAINLVLFSAAYTAQRYLPKRPDYPDEFGRLELIEDEIVQFDESTAIGRIDAVQPYEYRVLDRYDAKTAVFRLYQGPATITFRYSDPGASRIVHEVMGLAWPPPARHAGRSYPPPAL